MASVTVKVEGLDDLTRRMRRYGKAAEGAIEGELKGAAVETQRTAVLSIQKGPKTGEVYPPVQGRRGSPHQASAPGEPPATDTGRLASSITVLKKGDAWYAGTGEDYGLYLELGTRDMEPRPWLKPAAEHAAARLEDRLVSALKRIREGR